MWKFSNSLAAVLISVSALVGATAVAFGADSTAPQVTATQPANGATEVSPNLTEIVVTFDQDMDRGGMSFTGGGPQFPKVRGKPFWRSNRECILPVELVPDHSYVIGINSARHTNFRSVSGVPVQPLALRFTTGRTASSSAPATSGRTAHADAVRRLREAVEKRYSHLETRKVDWASMWPRFEPRLVASASARDFAVVAGEMLALTSDPHIWLAVDGATVAAFRRRIAPNVVPELLPRLVSKWTQHNKVIATGWAAPRVAYIAIHSWSNKNGSDVYEPAIKALDEFRNAPGLIVDVRLNSGGDDSIARQFASCFITKRSLYARIASLAATSSTGFGKPVERWLEPAENGRCYGGKVALLIGPANMSSAESFILMMKQSPAVTLIGQRSYGSSGNPKPHDLGNGVTVYLPSWKEFTPGGSPIECKGVPPDIEVPFNRETQSQRDPVLEKAVEFLKKNAV